MPELLQEAFTPAAVAARLEDWLASAEARDAAARKLDNAMRHREADGEPLAIAADEIMSCVKGA